MLMFEYLNRGFSVIPLKGAYGKDSADAKRPLIPWAEFQQRRPTEKEIQDWIRLYPDCGVGIVTGTISGIVVLDIDSEDALRWAEQQGLLETATVKTRKGIHVYFLHPGIYVPNAVNLDGMRMDIRGDGGYVVAPPTCIGDHTYHWIKDYKGQIAKFPETLLSQFGRKKRHSKTVRDLYGGVNEGERNISLTRIAGSLVSDGLTYQECLSVLLAVNEKNRPPLSNKEIENILKSIIGYQKERKRENIILDDSIFLYPVFVLSEDRLHRSGEINVVVKTTKFEKQWVVSSNSILGLGGPFDEMVWMAILKYVTEMPKPVQNPIAVKNMAALAKIMGIPPEEDNLIEIKQSIERICSTSIMCLNIFYGTQSYQYSRKRFSLIQKVILKGEGNGDLETERTNLIYLDGAIIAGINSGYTLPVDWNTYRSLKNHIARGLYKLLYHLGRKNNFEPIMLTLRTIFDRLQLDYQEDEEKAVGVLRDSHRELLDRKVISNITLSGYKIKYFFK